MVVVAPVSQSFISTNLYSIVMVGKELNMKTTNNNNKSSNIKTNIAYISDSVALQVMNDLENVLHTQGAETIRKNISRREAGVFKEAAKANLGSLKQIPELCTPDARIGCTFSFFKGDIRLPRLTVTWEARGAAQRSEYKLFLGKLCPDSSVKCFGDECPQEGDTMPPEVEALGQVALKALKKFSFRKEGETYSYVKSK